jgi:hypothetical protein
MSRGCGRNSKTLYSCSYRTGISVLWLSVQLVILLRSAHIITIHDVRNIYVPCLGTCIFRFNYGFFFFFFFFSLNCLCFSSSEVVNLSHLYKVRTDNIRFGMHRNTRTKRLSNGDLFSDVTWAKAGTGHKTTEYAGLEARIALGVSSGDIL